MPFVNRIPKEHNTITITTWIDEKVGRRKKLLAYLKGKDLDRYKALIAKLGLAKSNRKRLLLRIYLIEYKSMIEVKKWRNKSFI